MPNLTQTTNVPQAPVQLDEVKGEIILNDGRFITLLKIKVHHIQKAYRRESSDLDNMIALLTYATLIDGKHPSYQEVGNLLMSDLEKISKALFK